ncbi:MAG: heme-binding protein [Acetobacteraceae bacterium]|nr:heme-binding protein [Acetobacteraceae bacterium]
MPRATVRGDEARVRTLDSAFGKAYVAGRFRTPTTELAGRAAANPAFNGLRFIDKVIFAGGGLPIRAGRDAGLGAIAAAAAPASRRTTPAPKPDWTRSLS